MNSVYTVYKTIPRMLITFSRQEMGRKQLRKAFRTRQWPQRPLSCVRKRCVHPCDTVGPQRSTCQPCISGESDHQSTAANVCLRQLVHRGENPPHKPPILSTGAPPPPPGVSPTITNCHHEDSQPCCRKAAPSGTMCYGKLNHVDHFAKSGFKVGTGTSCIIQSTETLPHLSCYI